MAGVCPSRLRAADLRSVCRGLWARADRSYSERDIVAAYCRADSMVFAMGLTAARLWGFPLPGIFDHEVLEPPGRARRVGERTVHRPGGNGVDRRIHLGTTSVRRKETALVRWSLVTTASDDLITHPAAAHGPAHAIGTTHAIGTAHTTGAARVTGTGHVTGLDDMSGPAVTLTSRVRTLLDLASIVAPDALVMIGDHLVRQPRPAFEGRNEPYATLEQVREAAAHFTGRGALRVRAAMEQVRMSSDSPAETRLRLAFERAGLPEPLLNVPAREPGRDGEPAVELGEPDLHWPRWRVAVEHEGPSHLDAEQLPKDIARSERREGVGWIEVRMTARDLRDNCSRAVSRVRAALVGQGWSL